MDNRMMYRFTVLVSCVACYISALTLDTDTKDLSTPLLVKVCNNTAQISGQNLLHVVNANGNLSALSILSQLHQNGISTVTVSKPKELLTCVGNRGVKNILFILKACGDILNLVLSSLSKCEETFGNWCDPELPAGTACSKCELQTRWEFQNFCFLRREDSQLITSDRTKRCDRRLLISAADLKASSTLPDELVDITHGIFVHEIWNSENYLIFSIRGLGDLQMQCPVALGIGQNWTNCTSEDSCDLKFIFRFVWRVFRGRKTVICADRICYWYDAFNDVIYLYGGRKSESYFSFTWRPVNQEKVTVCFLEPRRRLLDFNTGYNLWSGIMFEVTELYARRQNIDVDYIFRETVWAGSSRRRSDRYEEGVKFGVDVFISESGESVLSGDFTDVDFSTGIDTGSLCFLAPPRGLIPEYAAIFNCFSLSVWLSLLGTLLLFFVAHHSYHSLQLTTFSQLYTPNDLRLHENPSTALTIYRYFLCTCQPRMLLGKLKTGKVLFITFSFSAFVLATILLVALMNVLSTRPRYPNMKTLRELEESDFLVQSFDLAKDNYFFSREAQENFTWVRQKLIESFRFQQEVLIELYGAGNNSNAPVINGYAEVNGSQKSLTSALKSMDTIMRSNVFISNLPRRFVTDNKMFFSSAFTPFRYEYQYVPECIMSYPFMYMFSRHSFYRDAINELLTRFIEHGVADRILNHNFLQFILIKSQPEGAEEETVRPYSLSDLRIAFICFTVGTTLGIIIFILELLEKC